MRKNFKIGMATCLVSALALVGAGMAVMNPVSASADTTAANVGFTMIEGASVRIGTSAQDRGIRFAVAMDSSDYSALMSQVGEEKAYKSISFGMVITLSENVSDSVDLTEENLFGANAKFDWNDGSANWEQAANTALVVNYDFAYLGESSVEGCEGKSVAFASLTKINDANLTKEFVARGYMVYTDAEGNTTYRMADYYGNDRANNTRSITYVAQKSIELNKVSDDDKTTLTEAYITHSAVASQTVNVTVNHHKKDVYGEETVYTETLTGNQIGATVTATALQEDEWIYDEEKSAATASGVVYANNKTVLDLYYDQDPTKAFDLWYVGKTASVEQTFKLDNAVTGGLRYDNVIVEMKLALVEGTMPRIKFYVKNTANGQISDPADNGWITVADYYDEDTQTYSFTTYFKWASGNFDVQYLWLLVEDGSHKLGVYDINVKLDPFDLRYDDANAEYQTRNFQWQNPTITGKHYNEYVKISFDIPRYDGTINSIQFVLYNSLTSIGDSTVRTNSSQTVYAVDGTKLTKSTHVLMSNFDLTASNKIEMIVKFPWNNDDHTVYTLLLAFRGVKGFQVMVDNINVELVPDFVPAA